MNMNPGRRVLIGGLVIWAALMSTACGDTRKIRFSAAWTVPGMRLLLTDERRDRYGLYAFTDEHCLRLAPGADPRFVSPEELAGALGWADLSPLKAGQDAEGVLLGTLEVTELKSTDTLPGGCAEGRARLEGEAGYRADAVRDFDILWQSFAESYAFFDLYAVDWAARKQEFRTKVSEDDSTEELVAVFRELLAPLEDGHIRLHWAGEDGEPDSFSPEAMGASQLRMLGAFEASGSGLAFEAWYESQLEVAATTVLNGYLGGQYQQAGAGELVWAPLAIDPTIGYLAIRSMDGYAGDDEGEAANRALAEGLDAALGQLATTRGLILDLRGNRGGRDDFALAVAARFVDRPRPVLTKRSRTLDSWTVPQTIEVVPEGQVRYSHPLVVLVNDRTNSAAEVLTLALRGSEQVIIMGEATNGALSDTLDRRLTRSLSFTLSHQVYEDADGQVWEGVGVPVDVEVAFEPRAGVDSGLDRAVVWFQEN